MELFVLMPDLKVTLKIIIQVQLSGNFGDSKLREFSYRHRQKLNCLDNGNDTLRGTNCESLQRRDQESLTGGGGWQMVIPLSTNYHQKCGPVLRSWCRR